MDTNIDLKLELWKKSIFDTINTNNFPPSVIFYCMKDIMNTISRDYENYINKMVSQQNKLELDNNNKDQEDDSKDQEE